MKHVGVGCAQAELFGIDREWTCHDGQGRSESQHIHVGAMLSKAETQVWILNLGDTAVEMWTATSEVNRATTVC